MFGLTKREQRWKAEQRVAETLAPVITAAIRAAEAISVEEARADANALDDLRRKYSELLYAVASKHPQETRHETALRYIRQAEDARTVGGPHCEPLNG